MTPVCNRQDQDLLLFAHRAVGPLKSFFVRLHVKHCPQCRARLNEFSGVSSALAAHVRTGMPRWAPAAPFALSTRTKLLLSLLLAGILCVGGQLALSVAHARRAEAESKMLLAGNRNGPCNCAPMAVAREKAAKASNAANKP